MLTPDQVLSKIASSRRPRPVLNVPFVLPHNEIEQALADCWAEVLGFVEVGVNDNFFDLGGDSLQMTQISSRMHARCGIDVSFGKFFDHPTIAGLAQIMRDTK
jgi:aryl carrier-like protein